MLIYNVTIKVDAAIADTWFRWLQQEHIPAIMNTGCYSEYKIVRLRDIDDSEGPTYAVQYFAPTREDYDRYIEQHATRFRQASIDKWGDRFIAFRTLMEVVG